MGGFYRFWRGKKKKKKKKGGVFWVKKGGGGGFAYFIMDLNRDYFQIYLDEYPPKKLSWSSNKIW